MMRYAVSLVDGEQLDCYSQRDPQSHDALVTSFIIVLNGSLVKRSGVTMRIVSLPPCAYQRKPGVRHRP